MVKDWGVLAFHSTVYTVFFSSYTCTLYCSKCMKPLAFHLQKNAVLYGGFKRDNTISLWLVLQRPCNWTVLESPGSTNECVSQVCSTLRSSDKKLEYKIAPFRWTVWQPATWTSSNSGASPRLRGDSVRIISILNMLTLYPSYCSAFNHIEAFLYVGREMICKVSIASG